MQHWLQVIEAAGLPCAPIHSVDQVMTHPQVLANDMVLDMMAKTAQANGARDRRFRIEGGMG